MQTLKYPTGQQDFVYLRENGYVYVDKTDIIHHLVNNPKYVFLARPRRFGKSLLLSTIETFFKGRKELFKGLAIEHLEKEWRKHPVFHLELSGMERGNFESLKDELDRQIREWEEEYGIVKTADSISSRFRDLINKSCKITGEKVVILVDEYDNPLINSLEDSRLHDRCKDLLKAVYSAIKGMDRYIRFAMITGVSRFSKTSVFSGLNNLNDISFDNRYASLCGFTLPEIRRFLWQGVEELALNKKVTPEIVVEMLKEQYDGYHFSRECPDIYNPFSLLNALDKSSIGYYWILSGAPTFLIDQLKKSGNTFLKIFTSEETEYTLGTLDVALFSPVALLYQTGYLTIKSYNPESEFYTLGVPNKEVNYGLFVSLLSDYQRNEEKDNLITASAMRVALMSGEPQKFLLLLQEFYEAIPYNLHPNKYELNFEKILYSLLRLIDLDVRSEVELSNGRIDLLITTGKYVYILELKMDSTPEKALSQIREKGYTDAFRSDYRKIFLIGVNFSSESRNIDSWVIESE